MLPIDTKSPSSFSVKLSKFTNVFSGTGFSVESITVAVTKVVKISLSPAGSS